MRPPVVETNLVVVEDGKTFDIEKAFPGGQGTVYKLRHRRTNDAKAFKIFNSQIAEEDLRREYEISKKIENRALRVAAYQMMYEYHFENAPHELKWGLLRPWKEGTTLAEKITGAPFAYPDGERWIGKICESLEGIHKCGVAHGDLKPGNIILCENEPWLIDLASTQTRDSSYTPSYTFGYVSPEFLARPGRRTPADDLFALALIAVELLTGENPTRDARTPEAVTEALLRLDVNQIRKGKGAAPIPEEINNAFRSSLLSVDPQARPRNTKDFSQKFQIASPTIAGAPRTYFAPTSHEQKKQKWPSVAPLMAAVVLLAFFGFLLRDEFAPRSRNNHFTIADPTPAPPRAPALATIPAASPSASNSVVSFESATDPAPATLNTAGTQTEHEVAHPTTSAPSAGPAHSIPALKTVAAGPKAQSASAASMDFRKVGDISFGLNPTTVGQFRQFALENGFKAPSGKLAELLEKGGSDEPMRMISWREAEDFCKWLTTQYQAQFPGALIRLPTDQEWSLAVGLDEVGAGTPEERGSKVTGRPANLIREERVQSGFSESGSLRLANGLAEWCADDFNGKGLKTVRGVPYKTSPSESARLRAAVRSRFAPSASPDFVGFRCVLDMRNAAQGAKAVASNR